MWPSSLLPALLAPFAAAVIEPRAPAAPRLVSYDLTGPGCPAASANTVTGSTSRLDFTFPDFASEIRLPERRYYQQHCLAALSVDEGVPGYRLAVRRVWGEGLFFGSRNVTLRVQSSAYFQEYSTAMVVKEESYRAEADRFALQPVSFDFDYEASDQRVVSKCVGDDGNVGTAYVSLRAILNWVDGDDTAVAAFLGTEDRPVVEHVEFAWVACSDVDEPVNFETPGDGEIVDGGEEEEEEVVLDEEDGE